MFGELGSRLSPAAFLAPPLRLGLKAKLITKKALGDIFQSRRAFSASNPREGDLR